MNKSELKRQCVQNPLDIAEEIDQLVRLCEEKDAEIKELNAALNDDWGTNVQQSNLRAKKQLSEAQAQITLLSGVFSREEELQAYLYEAQAQIAMQAEALKTCKSDWADGCYRTLSEKTYDSEKIAAAISATAETVAAWRAKEAEPLHMEVAMLREAIAHALDEGGDADQRMHTAITDTQATALAYEREVENRGAIKALENAKYKVLELNCIFTDTQRICACVIDNMLLELRANKGEVK